MKRQFVSVDHISYRRRNLDELRTRSTQAKRPPPWQLMGRRKRLEYLIVVAMTKKQHIHSQLAIDGYRRYVISWMTG